MENPPPAQVFLPGFTVRQLPLDLTNINNVLYRPDGTLVALAYNGDVWLLRDTDGDGLEDKAELFWESKGRLRAPIGMDLTPPGYKHGDGVFVTSKGKCSLIADTDRDGKADKETVIAEGWTELPHGVDALGVAFDKKDGSVYFGIGTTNFTAPYLIGKDGKATYALKDEHGTVMRIAPDFKSREVFATGIRFPVGLRFNKAGDLFATDQEGATWLANGNPLDELLLVQKGRHYGFPPRHPKHLPGVIDEPSVFDYGPQHQSTCGLNFNDPVTDGGPTFGPKDWAGDVIVSGYSRGKLYRTQLVPTPAGPVARTQLFACLNMLTVDACVAPDGSLLVACHSGGPDWGSGPTGKGKLYKIAYTDRDHPQPVFAWPAGPREVRVEFDRPVNPELLARRGEADEDHRRPGRPGRGPVRVAVAGVRGRAGAEDVDAARRAGAVGAAHPRPADADPGDGPAAGGGPLRGDAPRHGPAGEGEGLAAAPADRPRLRPVRLRGDVEARRRRSRRGPAGCRTWTCTVSRKFTAGSAHHDTLWEAMEKPGELTLKAQLDLTNMLRPEVQPGSKIDYQLPAEEVTDGVRLRLEGPRRDGGQSLAQVRHLGEVTVAVLTVTPKPGKPTPVEIRLPGDGRSAPHFAVRYTTAEDDRARSLPLRRAWCRGPTPRRPP